MGRIAGVDTILLAGGYATRLYPLTLDRPKALLPVGGKPILDHIVGVLDRSDDVGRMFLVTNARFAGQFSEWAARKRLEKPIRILNDGTCSNETRLGAIGDVQFVLTHADVRTEEGVYVLGTDNLARFDITEIIRLAQARKASAVFASRMDDLGRLRRMGVAVLDETGRMVEFEEKPQYPKSNLAVPPFYAYSPEAAGLVEVYLREGNNRDAPGHFIAWLVRRGPVYACRTEQPVYDVGTLEAYHAVCALYEQAQ